jgi:hypothetical protein
MCGCPSLCRDPQDKRIGTGTQVPARDKRSPVGGIRAGGHPDVEKSRVRGDTRRPLSPRSGDHLRQDGEGGAVQLDGVVR